MPITRLNTFEGVPLGKENFEDYLSYLLQLTARSNPFIESESSDFNELIALGSGKTSSLSSASDNFLTNNLTINNISTPNLFAYRHNVNSYEEKQGTASTNSVIDITPTGLNSGKCLVRVGISLDSGGDLSGTFTIRVNSIDVSESFSFSSLELLNTRYIYHVIDGVLASDTIDLNITGVSGSTGSFSISSVTYDYENWSYENAYLINFDFTSPKFFSVDSLTFLNVYFEDEVAFQSTDVSNFTPIDTIRISSNNDTLGSLLFKPDSTDVNSSLIFSFFDDANVEAEINVGVNSFKLSDTNLITLSGSSVNSFAFLTDDDKELYALQTYLIDGNYSTPSVDEWKLPIASIKELNFGSGSTGYGFEKSDLPDSFNRFSSSNYFSAKVNSDLGEYERGFSLVSLNGIPQVDSSQTSSTGFYDISKLKSSDIFQLNSLRLGSEYPSPRFVLNENHQYASEVIEGFSYVNANTSAQSSSLASPDYNNTLYFPYTDFLLSPSLLLIHYDHSENSEFYYYIPKEDGFLTDQVKTNHYRVIDPSSGEVRFNFNLNISSSSDVNDKFWIVSAEQLPSNTTNNVTDYFSSYGSLYYPTANLNVETKIAYFDPSLLVDTDLESSLPLANIIPSNKIISSGGGAIISDAEGEYTSFVLYGISYPGRVDADQFVRLQANKYEPDVFSFSYYCGISAEKITRNQKPYPAYIKLVENDISWYNRGINQLTYDPVSRAINSELCVVDVSIENGSVVVPKDSSRVTDLQRRSSLSPKSSTIDPSQTTFVDPGFSGNSFLVSNSSNIITSTPAPQGSILVGVSSSPPTSLSIGASDTVLRSNGTSPYWGVFEVSFDSLIEKTSGTGNYTTTGVLTGGSLVSTSDAFINSITVGKGGGNVATNTAVGASALSSNQGGDQNTAIGDNALAANLIGDYNTAVGSYAMYANVSGRDNTAVGELALGDNTTGVDNSAFGVQALFKNISGSENVALGISALAYNTVGSKNTAVGVFSLGLNTSGLRNTAVGYNSLIGNTTGSNSTGLGHYSLYDSNGDQNTAIGSFSGARASRGGSGPGVTTGSNLTLVGYDAQPSSDTATNEVTLGDANVASFRIPGISLTADANNSIIAGLTVGKGGGGISTNTAVGASALSSNTTGADNIAIGNNALSSNTTGSKMIAIGTNALSSVVDYLESVAVGYLALENATEPYFTVAVGNYALNALTTGLQNVAVGGEAMLFTTVGSDNLAVGNFALRDNTTGEDNTAIGHAAAWKGTTSSNNTAIGSYALFENTTGANNTAVGSRALSGTLFINPGSSRGNNNVALGYQSLLDNTGSNNTALGYNSGSTITTGSNLTVVGNNAEPSSATATNEVTLGDANVTSFRIPGIDLLINDSSFTYGGDLIPSSNLTYDLGSSDLRWNDLYVGNKIYLEDVILSTSDGQFFVNGSFVSPGGGSSLWSQSGSDIYYSAGNVGINTSSPSEKLDVDGNIRATGTITSLSDISKKENIKLIDDALSIVESLDGVYFNFIDNPEKRNVGLIAQSVEKNLPEVVFTHQDELKSVSYGNITAVLIEAVKELSKINKELISRIESIEKIN